MDHAGAVLGPLLATAFLLAYPGAYRTLFALALVPGAVAVALIFFVREEAPSEPLRPASAVEKPERSHSLTDGLPPQFTRFMLVLALFTLGNSTDAFLLLKLTDAAGGPAFIPVIWAALHVVKASASVFGGRWSDRIGRRGVIAAGWIVYAAVYVGFAVSTSLPALLSWFLVYGLYFGLTEGVEKAFVADLAPASQLGFAYGVYNAVVGLGAMAASVLFGIVWTAVSPGAAFLVGAALALVATVLLFAGVRSSHGGGSRGRLL
jgi:MFS family permease